MLNRYLINCSYHWIGQDWSEIQCWVSIFYSPYQLLEYPWDHHWPSISPVLPFLPGCPVSCTPIILAEKWDHLGQTWGLYAHSPQHPHSLPHSSILPPQVSLSPISLSPGRIWLDNLSCSGTEQSVTECASRGWGNSDCTHDEDAGVICKDQRLPGFSDSNVIEVCHWYARTHNIHISPRMARAVYVGRGDTRG